MLTDLAGTHVGVAQARPFDEPTVLALARGLDALADHGRWFGGAGVGKLLVSHAWHVDVDVDAVEQRARQPLLIFGNDAWRTRTLVARVIGITAWAGVHAGHEHEIGRKGQRALGARDRHHMIFERLTQHLERALRKLGQLVEERFTEPPFSGEICSIRIAYSRYVSVSPSDP